MVDNAFAEMKTGAVMALHTAESNLTCYRRALSSAPAPENSAALLAQFDQTIEQIGSLRR